MSQKRNVGDASKDKTVVLEEYIRNVAKVDNNNVIQSKTQRFTAVKIGETIECEVYKSATEKDKFLVVAESILKLDMAQGNEQSVAHAANVIGIIIPELKTYLDAALSENGIECVEVKLPSESAGVSLNTSKVGRYDWPVIMLLFGCIMFAVFKNAKPQTYYPYMRHRIKDMRALVGVNPSAVIEIPIKMEKADAIKSMLGVHCELKEAVLQAIAELSEVGDLFGSLCRYLLGVVENSEMTEPFSVTIEEYMEMIEEYMELTTLGMSLS